MTNKTRVFQIGGIFLILVAIFMAVAVQTFAAPADGKTEPSAAPELQTDPTDPEPVEPIEEDVLDDEYDPFAVTAELIGIDIDTLWEAVDSGQTIAEVAAANDVDPQTIIDALASDERSFIEQLVAEGEISEEEAAEWLTEVDEYAAEFVNEPFEFEEFVEFDDGYDPFPALVELLGIDEDALWQALDDGQTLAAVAQSHDVEPDAVVALLLEQEKAFIDELAAEGEISEEEAAEWLAESEEYIAEFVNEPFAFEEIEFEEFDAFAEDAALMELLGLDEDAYWGALESGQSLAEIAQAQGVEVEAVVTLLVDQENAFIDELLAEGEISEEEAAEWRADVEVYITEYVNEPFAFELIEYEDDYLAPVVEILGMDEDAIWEALESGQTLAQLAEAQGVELQALKESLIASEDELIDELLAEGEISEEEANEWRSFIEEDVDTWVNESWDSEYDDHDCEEIELDDLEDEESE